jgi:hypothetical protein
MKLKAICVAAVTALSVAGTLPVMADPYSIATSRQGGSIYSMALAMASAVEPEGLDLRPRPYKSTTQGLPFVNGGEVSFGLENSYVLSQAIKGEGRFKGNAMGDLRVIARLQPLRLTMIAREDSGMTSIADLKGKRVPVGFGSAVIGNALMSAMLASAGLTYDDVRQVKVSGISAARDAMAQGDVDATFIPVGASTVQEMDRLLGGVRALDLGDGPEALARVRALIPVATLSDLDPAERLLEIKEPTTVLQYDYLIYAHADTPDAVVTAMLRGLHGSKDVMAKMVPSLDWFEPAHMAADIDLPHHPAALAFFEAEGIVPR